MLGSNDSQSTLRSSLFGGKLVDAQHEDELIDSGLPDTSAPYQAHARPASRPVYTLHCCLGKDGYRSFQFVHLDSDSTFELKGGHTITLRFAGSKIMKVTITGRNLLRLWDYLHQHRMPWIMRADRDFAADSEPVITGIAIEEVAATVERLA